MVKRGLGLVQIERSNDSQSSILNTISDGEWHRYNEIVVKSGLSTATVSKHLKKMENGLIEKQIDIESGKYPYPVSYRVKTELAGYLPTKEDQKELPETMSSIINGNLARAYFLIMSQVMVSHTIKLSKTLFEGEISPDVFKTGINVFVIQNYQAFLEIYLEKLRELQNDGVDVSKLLDRTLKEFLGDMNHLAETSIERSGVEWEVKAFHKIRRIFGKKNNGNV